MAEITVDQVSFDYTDYNDTYNALRDVSFHIQDGEFLCLLGPSGCGKSTLLSLLAGLKHPKRGSILLNGEEIQEPGTESVMVFQSYSLFPWMTAKKNVLFAIQHSGKKTDKAEAERIAVSYLAAVGMDRDMDKYPYQLSGGMRQRVAIARAFAMDTDLLLLDEPFGALDTKMRTELQGLLERLWQNKGAKRKTVVFVTHDIDEAILLADRVLFMCPGEVTAEIEIRLPRPRREWAETEAYREIRQRLDDLFYGERQT